MVEVFSFQPNLGSFTMFCQAIGELKVGRAIHIGVVGSKLFPEQRIIYSLYESLFQLYETIEERFGDVLAPEFSKTSWEALSSQNSG